MRSIPVAVCVLLFLALLQVNAEESSTSFSKLINGFESAKLEEAVSNLNDFPSWNSEKKAAFLLGTRALTNGDTVGAYRLYFFSHGCLTADLAPHLSKALKSEDVNLAFYAFTLLNSIRPKGLEDSILDLYWKTEEAYAERISPAIGFYGVTKETLATERGKLPSDLHSEVLLFRLASISQAKATSIEKKLAGVKNPTTYSIAAYACSGSEKSFELAEQPAMLDELKYPWIWRILAEQDAERTLELFAKTIAPKESELADYIDSFCPYIAQDSKNFAPMQKLANTLFARDKVDAALRVLTWCGSEDSAKLIRTKVLASERLLDKIQRFRYLVEIGSYASLNEILECSRQKDVTDIPRRKSWLLTMLSYFSDASMATYADEALNTAKMFSARCAATATLSRINPKRASEILPKLVEEWKTQWTSEWKKTATDYNSTELPNLYQAMQTLSSAISELSPQIGLPLLKEMLASIDPFFFSDVLSGCGWWCRDSSTVKLLNSYLGSENIAIASAAANIAAFVGDPSTYTELIKAASSKSLGVSENAILACNNLACAGLKRDGISIYKFLNNARNSLPKTISNPEDKGKELLPGIDPKAPDFVAIGKILQQNAADEGKALAILRYLQQATGTRFVHVPDYHDKYLIHDPGNTLSGCFANRRKLVK